MFIIIFFMSAALARNKPVILSAIIILIIAPNLIDIFDLKYMLKTFYYLLLYSINKVKTQSTKVLNLVRCTAIFLFRYRRIERTV